MAFVQALTWSGIHSGRREAEEKGGGGGGAASLLEQRSNLPAPTYALSHLFQWRMRSNFDSSIPLPQPRVIEFEYALLPQVPGRPLDRYPLSILWPQTPVYDKNIRMRDKKIVTFCYIVFYIMLLFTFPYYSLYSLQQYNVKRDLNTNREKIFLSKSASRDKIMGRNNNTS